MAGQIDLPLFVEKVANEDAETIRAHVLVGGEIGVAQLLLDGALIGGEESGGWG